MSENRLQGLHSLLTERFAALAAELYGEVQSVVEAYEDEHKRLRSIIYTVLSPEVKLHKIDLSGNSKATTVVSGQPPEPNTAMDHDISQMLTIIPKEEPFDWTESLPPEQQQEVETGDGVVYAESMNTKGPEGAQDVNVPFTADSLWVKEEACTLSSTDTLSVDEQMTDDEQEEDSSWGTDSSEMSSSEESDSESQETKVSYVSESTWINSKGSGQKSRAELPKVHKECSPLETDSEMISSDESDNESQATQGNHITIKTGRNSKESMQKTMLELPRTQPHKPLTISSDYELDADETTTMEVKSDMEYVNPAFGTVTQGCRFYVPLNNDYWKHIVPQRPPLPLPSHELDTDLPLPTLTAHEIEHVGVMQISEEGAQNLESSTRDCKETAEELYKLRLTSHFKEICNLKHGNEQAELLLSKIQSKSPRCTPTQKEQDMKTKALQEYCQNLNVNWYPCGLVIHPSAPWVGALPDGLVYDPNEKPTFGLVHIKYTGVRSFTECKFMVLQDGVLTLNTDHRYYWHVQGEMMVTGTSWCDLLIISREGLMVQRIFRDEVTIKVMTRKLHHFFFCHYLRNLLYTGDQF